VIERVVRGQSYFIAEKLASADVIINLCKLKTHSLTLYTGAIKNMFGAIPGVKKGEFHKIAPKVRDFSEFLVDIFEAAKPHISIMDAVIGMEGNGPSSGQAKKFGYIIASRDAVALDAVGSYIMGYDVDEILTTEIAHQRNLGEKDFNRIKFRGIVKEDLAQYQIILPTNRLYQSLPEFLLKLAGKLVWIRPKANEKKCKRCGMCITNCPVKAMESVDGFPVIDYNICIKCFCCDEICPYNAIDLQMSWLARKLR
jgi:Pyruvate/2-oxoacid:ferredoxin oxidoreductase delta subunit